MFEATNMFTEKHKETCGGHGGAPAGHLLKTGVSQHPCCKSKSGEFIPMCLQVKFCPIGGGGEGLFRFGTCRSQLKDYPPLPLQIGTAVP